jgi:hypothetical protein
LHLAGGIVEQPDLPYRRSRRSDRTLATPVPAQQYGLVRQAEGTLPGNAEATWWQDAALRPCQ